MSINHDREGEKKRTKYPPLDLVTSSLLTFMKGE